MLEFCSGFCQITDVREPDRIFCHCANVSSYDYFKFMQVSSTCFKLSLLRRARYLSCKMARVDISHVNKALHNSTVVTTCTDTRTKFFKLNLSHNIFRACERLNYKYVNRLKRTGKLLTAQMLPGLYLCVSTKFQLDLNGIYRKRCSRIISSVIKPTQKTNPKFILSPNSNISV